ncbi:hypothetical protein IMSAG044_01673 [Lactobacillaceae bacterium]|nr:hypothetical protein IMSAG044_01673 [Lactobacillaceae bacterium]
MSNKEKTIQQVHSELSTVFDTYWLVAGKNATFTTRIYGKII